MDRGRSRGGRSKDNNTVKSRSRSRSRGRDRSRDRPANARLADKRVYISNIPYDSRWQDIKDLFRKEVGEVSFVELFCDESDKPRGCGVIEFENPPIAKKAIEKMHRFELGGRKIVVKEDYDVERDKTGRIITGSNRNKEEQQRGDRDRSRDDRVVILRDRERLPEREWERDDQGSQGTPKWGNTYGLSQQFLEQLGVDGQLIPKVFVSNLDFRVDEKKLKEVFKLAGRVLEVDLNRDKDGKSRGHGVIEFEHPVEAVQAISMFNNQQLFERRMHVKMDRLADPSGDRLPDGLKGIGMGLGVNGQPLIDVSRNLPSGGSNSSSLNTVIGNNSAAQNQNQTSNSLASSMNTLAAMNVNPTFGNLASLMSNSQGLDALGGMGTPAGAAAAVAAANAFGVAGMNAMGALNTSGGQFGNLGGPNANSLAAAMQNVGGLAGMQGNPIGNNPMSLMGNSGSQIGTPGGIGGGGVSVSTPSSQQQSPFQTHQTSAGQSGGSGMNMRDIDYGYSTSVYSTPSNNFGGNKPSFGNGHGVGSGNVNVNSGSGGAPSVPSNTVIVANLPPSCTWQMLKTKFRECGDVVFAEMRDKSTGIVRFASERDAERAVKVFDQSRVDGRTVEVRFL